MINITLEDILDKFIGTIRVVSVYGDDIFFGSKDDFYSFDFSSADLDVVTLEVDSSAVDTILITVSY